TFESGTFKSDGNEYHLAELGCGFNTDTTISPIFGAMLISAIVNSGNIILPSIVEHVNGSDGQIIYKNKTTPYKEALQPQTAAIMMKLMERTITKGTAKKSFRGVKRDKVLSKILIGGKTGSLYNKGHTIKYDWFTGFGKEKTTDRKIVLSIVVGHGKYIGTRASAYAKMILKQYFKKTLDATAKL
ncbi:penicillin-binding transpeptidase domain-containing protein, partial [Desulfobacula sp.]